jgi:hypothetical protein
MCPSIVVVEKFESTGKSVKLLELGEPVEVQAERIVINNPNTVPLNSFKIGLHFVL